LQWNELADVYEIKLATLHKTSQNSAKQAFSIM
jgi:hypothetical protein